MSTTYSAEQKDRRKTVRYRDLKASRDRNRCEEPEQERPAHVVGMTAEERVHKRVRQAVDLDSRHKTGACDLPEMGLRKVFAPEDLPASDGPLINAEAFGELADSAW